MKTRNTFYSHVDRHGEAAGVCLLTLPFRDFWPQIEDRFSRRVVKFLYQDRTMEDPDRLLELSHLRHDATSLAEWFVDCETPSVDLASDSIDALAELAAIADDLARDDGEWKGDARVLDQAVNEAVADLRERFHTLKRAASAQHGPQGARACLELVRRSIEQEAEDTRQPERWTIERTAELEKVARELRALAHAPGLLKRAMIKVSPKAARWLVLGDMERNLVSHQFLPTIQRAAKLRFEHERTRRLDWVRRAILGRPGKLGLLDDVIAELNREVQYFRQVAATSMYSPSSSKRTALHEIRIVETLDEVIDRKTGCTLAEIYGRALKRSGCTARALADRIREEGLTIRGRRYAVCDWPRYLTPAEVRGAVQREVAWYLGSSRRDVPINIVAPRTAFEHAAAITPLHPALRSRVVSLIPAWTRQSRPYADTEVVVGAEPQVYRFLYCHPGDRRNWEQLVCAQITLSKTTSDTGALDAFATKHPYVAILVQHALAIPLGALKTLPDSTSQANLLRRTDAHTALIDRHSFAEVRVLATRPSGYSDSETLFAAGRKASIILPVPQDTEPKRYAMTIVTGALERVFSPDLFEPDLLTDESFHKALAEHSFREFIVLTFPQAADFHQVADRLAREHDSTTVADDLVQRGILKPGSPRHYRLNAPKQHDQGNIPQSLFVRRRGPLVGLTHDDFVSQLHRHDSLYNALFWRVVDAVELNRLSQNDVPEFVRRFVRVTP